MAWHHALISRLATFAVGALGAACASAQQTPSWELGAVLDTAYTSRALALGSRDQGLQLGHSDVTASGPLGELATARVTAVFATHEGRLEREIEEAWIESTRLPAGVVARVGRFASQIGYLNAQHPHADDFVERPLLHRAFFGGHWNDDGVRLNWTAPMPFFLQLGVEAFRGKRLVEETAEPTGNPGIATVVAKFGGDIGASHSWLVGVSHIRNRREAATETYEGAHGHQHDHEHDHHHHHGAQFSGRKTWMIDATWKWAPGGNNRDQQVRAGFEAARVTELNRYATSRDRHEAQSIWAVWRFRPDWEAGVRTDRLRVRMPHGDHFHNGRLREVSAMLVWKPSHMQSLRLQFTRQYDAVGFNAAARRSIQLQYVLAFGAHPAHPF
jgi:hypothetical protein